MNVNKEFSGGLVLIKCY